MTPRVISPYLDRPGWAKGNNSLMCYFIVEWGEGSLDLHAGSESGHNSFG